MRHLKFLAQCITFWACEVLSSAVPVAAPFPDAQNLQGHFIRLVRRTHFLPLAEFASESVEYVKKFVFHSANRYVFTLPVSVQARQTLFVAERILIINKRVEAQHNEWHCVRVAYAVFAQFHVSAFPHQPKHKCVHSSVYLKTRYVPTWQRDKHRIFCAFLPHIMISRPIFCVNTHLPFRSTVYSLWARRCETLKMLSRLHVRMVNERRKDRRI